ncbi:relaxase/mobilization nuclease domain-containing protein [Pedobacter chitinilyticus]|uniref:Relaxase n=1 Tax=Pedobacter chitinilyticus TaxID=2233776 RepID=A0A443YW76_9SPHI|nr:relaxase/mobilization nuclease domain-containing protein [Pedobacter chitinilyticus]RWU08187.1 relaxase [Pedobacter chitinilyticus]
MVAIIGSGVSIRRAFLYNEHKVETGAARCIMAANYPLEIDQMQQVHRLKMLTKTASLNPDVKRNCIHISLNFAPTESPSDQLLSEIATEYMDLIGFGGQPFLAYRHHDAGHPHIHIVSTNIRPDGSRIDTFQIGKKKSEPARKLLEKKHGLVAAEQQKKHLYTPVAIDPAKVIYGKQDTVKAISAVLQNVLSDYRYTSLSELNAVLGLYHIQASRGAENSRTYKHRGLLYRVLDGQGQPVGVPLKASAIHNNPGLKFLEKKYLANDVQRADFRARTCSKIDLVLLRNANLDLGQFIQKLKEAAIDVVPRINEKGQLYGLTYVDHQHRCVFNGSALGKKYTASAILKQLRAKPPQPIPSAVKQAGTSAIPSLETTASQPPQQPNSAEKSNHENTLLDELMGYQYADQHVPLAWRKKKKRKKKR